MARKREPRTFDEAVKMIEAIAPDRALVNLTQGRDSKRDRLEGSIFMRFEYRCSMWLVIDGKMTKLFGVESPNPAHLVKQVMIELVNCRGRLGLPPLEPAPKPARQTKRVAHRQPLLSYQR